MDILNTERTANAAGTLAMDQELLEAAMLHAREISVYPSSNRPNGENAIYLLDGTGHTRFYLLQVSAASSDAKLILNAWFDTYPAMKAQFLSPDYVCGGVGCFQATDGTIHWVVLLGNDAATKVVKSSDYRATVTRTVKIALKNTNAASWNAKHTHSYQVTSTVKANATKNANGKITRKCSVCGKTTTSTLYAPKTVTLSAASYTYDGKVKKPSVTVKDSKGGLQFKLLSVLCRNPLLHRRAPVPAR